jgi:dipeptidase
MMIDEVETTTGIVGDMTMNAENVAASVTTKITTDANANATAPVPVTAILPIPSPPKSRTD